jgi:U4/U6 small nuclear ribonucleoprotein PRP3
MRTEPHRPEKKVKPMPFDRKIPTVVRPATRQFSFLPPGVVADKAEARRKEAETDRSVVDGFPLFDVIALSRNVETPSIDWWDLPFVVLDDAQLPVPDSDGQWRCNFETVTNEYENAAPVETPAMHSRELPTILTVQERKRLKHITKLEKRNQEHLMIKLGLKEKEIPTLKPGQMIAFSSGKTPTQIEMEVRKARDDRMKKHEDANAAAKLTPEQRGERNATKRKKDSEDNLTVTVYSMRKLEDPLQCAKLSAMARKWFITGGIFIVKWSPMAFVVIEAGEKGTKKYAGLVKQRIHWEEGNEAVESFQGPALKRSFFNFHKYLFDVTTQCRSFFEKNHAVGLFDAAARFSVPD